MKSINSFINKYKKEIFFFVIIIIISIIIIYLKNKESFSVCHTSSPIEGSATPLYHDQKNWQLLSVEHSGKTHSVAPGTYLRYGKDYKTSYRDMIISDDNDDIKANNNLFCDPIRGTVKKLYRFVLKPNNIEQEQAEIYNPSEYERSYSSVWDNNKIGTGHAQSTLDSQLAWCSKHNVIGQYMTIDLGFVHIVKGVVTQGRGGNTQWSNQRVTRYKVSYSTNNVNYTPISNGKVFNGNTDSDTKRENLFYPDIQARYIRIYPQSWEHHMSMRAGVIIKPVYKGFKVFNPAEKTRSYSSIYDNRFINSRLFVDHAGWAGKKKDVGDFMSFKLDEPKMITGVIIESPGYSYAISPARHTEWLTKYKVSYIKPDEGIIDNAPEYFAKYYVISKQIRFQQSFLYKIITFFHNRAIIEVKLSIRPIWS